MVLLTLCDPVWSLHEGDGTVRRISTSGAVRAQRSRGRARDRPHREPRPTRSRTPSGALGDPAWNRSTACAIVLSRSTERPGGPECDADVAQLVAHHLAKVRVAGSNPVIRSEGSRSQESSPGSIPFRWSGRVVRQRPAKPSTRVRFPSPPLRPDSSGRRTRAISSAGERFPDTEEVTGSIPVSRTRTLS